MGILMRYVSVRELKNQVSEVLRAAQRDDVVITSRGKPVALLQEMSAEDLEDYIFYAAAPVRRELERRWKAYRRSGKTVSLKAVRAGLRRGRD